MAKIALILLPVIVLAAWYFAGAPIPGRYQLVVGGPAPAIMTIDTITGKIRLFAARKATTTPSEQDYRTGSIELIELTK